MAKQVLPTNFQDDVLNASMNGKRRYMLLQQDDGSYILNDVTNYDTEGSTFGAAQINATNQAVNQSVDKDDVLNTSEEVEANTDEKKVTGALVTKQLISELTANGNQFYFDYQNGQYGYNTDPARGADTFVPFSGGEIEILYAQAQAIVGTLRTTIDQDIAKTFISIYAIGYAGFTTSGYSSALTISNATEMEIGGAVLGGVYSLKISQINDISGNINISWRWNQNNAQAGGGLVVIGMK